MQEYSGHKREQHVFDLIHPAVQLGCFAAILAFTMLAIQPILLGITFTAAFAFSVYARGWRASLRTLSWQLPLIILCAAINPVFSTVGSTEVFVIGSKAVYLESIVFGACMGLMLAAVITWFFNAAQVLSSDKVLSVLGNTAPTIGLMVSMIMRLVPQFVERGRLIDSTAQAVSSAAPRNKAEQTRARIRLVSVLMGWSMEDSLETADAMRARAWSSTRKRTSYQRYRFGTYDTVVSLSLSVLVVVNALIAWAACTQFQFFPTLGSLALWWGYIPYALFMSMPLLLCLTDDLKWGRVP